MSAASLRAAEVEAERGAAWTRYHVGAQAGRFLAGVVVSLLLSLHSGFSDWTALLPLIAGAAWTTAAQMWPQVPWTLVREHFGTAAPAPAAVPPPVAGTNPAPPAKG